jgi:hypothetical protein
MRRFLFPLLLLVALLLVIAAPAFAASLSPPWDGNPVSPLLSPTSFGLDWAGGSYATEAVASKQGAPLALIPNSAIGPTLGLIQTEASSLGVPHRMDYMVSGKSAGGRDMYVVVVNALETTNQRIDYARWQNIRNIELTDPVQAQALLASYGENVKMPIYIEADINGTEYEGTDAMMQAIRDLTTTPRGQNATIDKILDHCILVVVPTANPDGRVAGRRGNDAVADTNRDYFIQSQPEEKNDAAIQQQYLAPGGLHMHGYYTPTLDDGLTMPHNPGLQYDIFAKWNQLRTAQNKVDFNAMGYQMQIPVNDWDGNGNSVSQYTVAASPTGATESGNTVTITTTGSASQMVAGAKVSILGVAEPGYNGVFTVASKPDTTHFTYINPTSGLAASGGGTVCLASGSPGRGPAYAQGWDDWGPFYGQTYMAFLGIDSSTVEMSSTTRLVSKTAQYVAFYSSANFWLDRRQDMIHDQLEIFRRGVTNAPTDPNAISKVPMLVDLGFTDALHNWMPTYPKAYVIPWGQGQRSDAAANRLAQWCLDNGIQVQRMASDFTWGSQTFQAGSYVVSMSQALRGLAWNALSAGTDIETRITDLYASPAAWSHGLLWGADTLEIPLDDATFAPSTNLIFDTNSLVGGVRGGVDAPAGFYSVTLKGVNEDKAVLALLRSGVSGLIAEAPFTSTTGGATPAGSLIFPADSTTAAALDAAGKAGGRWFERNVGVTMPATTVVPNAPKIAILVSSVPTSGADTDGCLTRIFGSADARYVATVSGAGSLENSATSPLANFDVIYNAGASFRTSGNIAASAAGATETGNTVTITTTSSHNLAVGATVTIAGVGVAGYNGTYTVTGVPSSTTFTYTDANAGLAASGSTASAVIAASAAGATETGNTVTITTTSSHSFAVGDSVTIASVGVSGYNGTYTVTGVPSSTTFTYIRTTTGLAASGGGTATRYDATVIYTGAENRLNAFFARGGGYIASNVSSNNFSFLTSAVPALVSGSLTQTSQNAFGGIAVWTNVGGANSPLTGPYPSSDYMFLPSNTTFFSATPTGAIVDAQYPSAIATIGPANGYVAGMWLNRDVAANNAPVLIHGTTTAASRYVAYATNPFSRYDAEREWPLIVQAALWSDLTDEGQVAFTITATAGAGGAISPSGANMVAVGADKTYTITPDTGYHIVDVLVDGVTVGPVTSYDFQNVAIGHTIAASFAINTYTITPSAGANGTISPNTVQTVNYGATPTFTITPAAGYSVADVLVDGTSVGAVTSYPFPSVTANRTISATFAVTVTRMKWKVTLKLSKSSVKVNTKVKYSGTVRTSTGRAGSGVVTIQKRRASGGSWINWRTDRLNASGNYSITVKMTNRGTWSFHARMPGDAVNRTGFSAPRKLRVY